MFLFHPKFTMASTIGALTATAAATLSFVAALDPIEKLPILARFLPEILRFNGDIIQTGVVCGALAGALSVLAGLGRSFAPLIDAGPILGAPTKA